MDRREHWQQVYQRKADAELSWFQERPAAALTLIDSINPPPRRAIDVGGGQSSLAGALLDRGISDVTVLDISAAAIERAQARHGARAGQVRWLAADILDDPDLGTFDLWHDRAVFHFLTDPQDRRRYANAAARAVSRGGHMVIATFAPTGPEKCSGLPVCRYDERTLADQFAPAFQPVRTIAETHTTPWGKTQDFTTTLFRRV